MAGRMHNRFNAGRGKAYSRSVNRTVSRSGRSVSGGGERGRGSHSVYGSVRPAVNCQVESRRSCGRPSVRQMPAAGAYEVGGTARISADGVSVDNARQARTSCCGDSLRYLPHSRYAFDTSCLSRSRAVRGKKIALVVASVLLALLVGMGVAVGAYFNQIDSNLGFEDEAKMGALKDVLAPAPSGKGAFYMLVIGSDARDGEASRSDVLMLARIDSAKKTVHLISIPRDTMVDIEGYGTNKINAAYAYGGPALTVETVSKFAGVPISHYAEINFAELESLVDLLGGVTVNVPEAFTSKVTGVSLDAGNQTLSGREALGFVRERKSVSGGDFGRAQAQRQVAEAIIRQILATPSVELPGVVVEAARCVSTDWGVKDIVGLALDFQGKGMELYSTPCPSYAHNIDGVSYVCTKFNEWKTIMQRVDAGLDPNDEESVIPEEQLNNEGLGAAANSPAPRDYHAFAANSMSTDDVAKVS